ncbi:hypothetical protein, partial [Pseudomonas aeruginosa]
RCLVGSEMCIRDRVCLAAMAVALLLMLAPRQAATEPSLGGQIPH